MIMASLCAYAIDEHVALRAYVSGVAMAKNAAKEITQTYVNFFFERLCNRV